ncbi:MAG: hypothetical protein H6713_37185 [Myxococcales bacterium]|nr:hypothetical protein [Myxococcales bacterium]MCB9755599.1 hypothetical protein [Myxococcales bacterium]
MRWWVNPYRDPEPEQVELVQLLESGSTRPVITTIEVLDHDLRLIRPRGGWKPDARYRLTTRARSRYRVHDLADKLLYRRYLDDQIREFTVRKTPLELDATARSSALTVTVQVDNELSMVLLEHPSACEMERRVLGARVSLSLAPELAPLRESFQFATLVDGQPWWPRESSCLPHPRGRSWRHRSGAPAGNDLVVVECPVTEDTEAKIVEARPGIGVAPGDHVVEIVARLPDGGIELRSTPTRFTLTCPNNSGNLIPLRSNLDEIEVVILTPATDETNASSPPPVAPRGGCHIHRRAPAPVTIALLLGLLVTSTRQRQAQRED